MFLSIFSKNFRINRVLTKKTGVLPEKQIFHISDLMLVGCTPSEFYFTLTVALFMIKTV